MPRARNAKQRRAVLADLKYLKNWIKRLEAEWDVRSTVYVPMAERLPGDNAYQRDRLPEEYPEEQAESWAHVYNAADEMIKRATAMRENARMRYFEVKDAQNAGGVPS